MVNVSLLIPLQAQAGNVRRQVEQAQGVLRALGGGCEILLLDLGVDDDCTSSVAELAAKAGTVRLLAVPPAAGLDGALSHALRQAQGEVIVVSEAGQRYPPSEIATIVRHLSRADFASARRRVTGWRKLAERVARIPRWLTLGLDVHDPGCLLWAARREALDGIELHHGLHRYLPSLVASRGFRVGEVYVDYQAAVRRPLQPRPTPWGLVRAWRTARRNLRERFEAPAIAGKIEEHRGGQHRRSA